MERYLLIGGIGSGKSAVCALLCAHGAYCLDLDALGHEALEDAGVAARLVQAFGEGILSASGRMDRAALARAAFSTPESTAALNDIMHPRILQLAQERLAAAQEAGFPLAVVEASAYDGPGRHAGLEGECSGIVAVVADEPVRMSRCLARGMDEAEVRARMDAQASDDQRRAWASHVVENNGTREELACAVDALWEGLLAAAERRSS